MYTVRLSEEVTILREVIVEVDEDPRGKELSLTEAINPTRKEVVRQDEIYKPILVEILDIREGQYKQNICPSCEKTIDNCTCLPMT